MSEHDPGVGPGPATGARKEGRRLAAMLSTVAAESSRPRVSVRDLLDSFGQRAFGALTFIFAIPNALPVYMPGLSAILGTPLSSSRGSSWRATGSPGSPG